MEQTQMFSHQCTGEVLLRGKKVSYTETTEEYPVCVDGTIAGTTIIYTYLRNDVDHAENRPVLFAFNGGPGSSAMWIHTGLLAPYRLKCDTPLHMPTEPPVELEVNPYCMLDFCDIVIIDPVGTGFTRVFDDAALSKVFSVDGDARIFADLILRWVDLHNRWNSKKYLLGESYGTVRACEVANLLTGGPTMPGACSTGVSISGLILMGALVIVHTDAGIAGESAIEHMALDLPAMAATNWYHRLQHKVDFASYMNDVYSFVENRLLTLLYKGGRMTEAEEAELAETLSHYTGVSAQYIRSVKYRLTPYDFAKQTLAEDGKVVGLYDSRYTMPLAKAVGIEDPVGDESAMGTYTPAFRTAFMKMAKEILGLDISLADYKIINYNVNGRWDFHTTKTPFQCLQSVLRRSPTSKVLFCNGYYDLMTTTAQSRYTASQLDCREDQVILGEYPSGHMQYIGEKSVRQLYADMCRLICGGKHKAVV